MKKLLLILMLPLLATTAWSQKYHDAAIDEVKGNPKEVKITHDGTTQTFTYDASGKVHKQGWTNPVYNSQGYMTSVSVSTNGVEGTITIAYNSKGQMTRMVTDLADNPITNEFVYDDKGNIKSQISAVKIPFLGSTVKTTMNWTYNSFDDRGNWTSRTGKVKGKKTTQTRTILYW